MPGFGKLRQRAPSQPANKRNSNANYHESHQHEFYKPEEVSNIVLIQV
jgi:hypothetical protein